LRCIMVVCRMAAGRWWLGKEAKDMRRMKDFLAAGMLALGLVLLIGGLFVAAAPVAVAATPVPVPVPGCSGDCVFSNGSCSSNPADACSGTGCACPTTINRDECSCKM
jgi:hypothetical protein